MSFLPTQVRQQGGSNRLTSDARTLAKYRDKPRAGKLVGLPPPPSLFTVFVIPVTAPPLGLGRRVLEDIPVGGHLPLFHGADWPVLRLSSMDYAKPFAGCYWPRARDRAVRRSAGRVCGVVCKPRVAQPAGSTVAGGWSCLARGLRRGRSPF